MDSELRDKFAPRRNKRYANVRSFNDEGAWADGLDWKTNDYDFFRLVRSLYDRLDLQYRGQFGLRMDQIVTKPELMALGRSLATWYLQEEQLFSRAGIYVFMHVNLDLTLREKASGIEMRRYAGQRESYGVRSAPGNTALETRRQSALRSIES